MAAFATPAQACRFNRPMVIEDAVDADLVVVGWIKSYRIERNMEFRRKMLANPDLPESLRAIYSDPDKHLGPDFAHFEIVVSEVVRGEAPKRLEVVWSNSTFGQPERIEPGPYLFALLEPISDEEGRGKVHFTPATGAFRAKYHPLQAPCGPAFIVRADSDEAVAIREAVEESER